MATLQEKLMPLPVILVNWLRNKTTWANSYWPS